MKYREPKPATILAAVLATEPETGEDASAYRVAHDAESLVRLGNRAAKIAEKRCNGVERYDDKARRMLATWTEADDEKAEKACECIRREASEILAPYGATVESVSGDPRGFFLTFRLASGRSNSMGGKVWGV